VVGVFEDRASGASLARLGLDALRDAASAGGVDVVLAQDRDRLSRDPAHVYLLREEFRGHGTTLRALNDRGDDSPEWELTDGILDQLAKFERAKTAERTRRGRMRKAQEGKVVGTGTAPYGFYYADDHYHIEPERMPYVHKIFEMIADGHSIYAVAQHLRGIGAPSPRGAVGKWGRTTIRDNGGADLDAAIDNDLSYGSKETAARRRQEFYRKAGLRVKVGEALEISLGIGEGVSKHVTLSGETGRYKPGRVRGDAGGIPGQGG